MKIDFANLGRGYQLQKQEIDAAMADVVTNASFIMGKPVFELEETLAEYTGARHAISCSSGTDALLLALMALGIGAGDEVITTPFTFIATGEVIALVGAKPVFVDISEVDYNIDIHKIEAAITPNTKAIIPVSLYGQMPDLEALQQIGKKYNIAIIEDAAQSFGATLGGKKSCSISDISCTSFFPAKPLGCFGDGGAVFTNDDQLSEILTSMRIHGQTERYHHKYIGLAGRLDTLQAVVLNAKIKRYDQDIKGRQDLANFYNDNITLSGIVKPKVKENYTSVWAQYTIQVEYRDSLQKYLQSEAIPTAVHYPKPLHKQECFDYLQGQTGDFPVSERVSEQVISLPMNPYFTEEEKQYIVDIVNKYQG